MITLSKVTALLITCNALIAISPIVNGADLSSIYQDALIHDSQLQGAKSELQATLEGRAQISAAYYPTIALNANALSNRSQTNSDPTISHSSKGYGITLKQGLYHRDIIVSSREIDSGITQAQLGYALAEQELILRVANSYFDLLAAQDGLDLARAEKRAISQQLKQAKQRFDVGLSAITDVHEAQAGFDLVVAQEIAAQTSLDNTKETLREIVGKAIGEVSVLQVNLPLTAPDPADINHWIKLAYEENLSLKIQRVATEIARHGIDQANAGHHPSIDLVGSYDYSDNLGNSSDEKRSSYIGLRLDLPLYSGGYTRSKARESNFRYQQAQYALEQQRRATESAVRSSYLGVSTGISQVKAYRQALASNQTSYEATQAGFEAGTRTTLDLLNAQREQFRSRRDYAQARYNYLLATLKLKEVVGALTESDLQQINDYLK